MSTQGPSKGEVNGPRPEDKMVRESPRARPTQKRSSSKQSSFLAFLRGVIGTVMLIGLVALAGAGAFAWHTYQRYATELPSLDGLRTYQPKVMSRVYADDDRLLAEFATERRIFVPISAIPDMVKQAFISAEDQNFWTHRGVDPLAIARAGVSDLLSYGSGRRPIGASTITQQVAKNMLLGNEVSMSRKIKELILALRIDQTMSKEHVLELYLNEIYLGQQSYGVAAAAAAYFNKTLDELSLPEAAFLGALPKAPNNYNPFRNPDAAKARRDWVLDRMADDHAISPAQARAAKATPIQPAVFRRPDPIPGGDWYSEEVRRQLIDRFGTDLTTTGGYTVRTSLDPVLQAAADKALRAGLMAYDRKHGGWRGPGRPPRRRRRHERRLEQPPGRHAPPPRHAAPSGAWPSPSLSTPATPGSVGSSAPMAAPTAAASRVPALSRWPTSVGPTRSTTAAAAPPPAA